MPIYTFEHSRELTQEQKAALAARVCEIHTTVMRAPAEYVRCAFFRLEPHSGYVAGKPDEDYLALKVRPVCRRCQPVRLVSNQRLAVQGEIRPGRPHQMEQSEPCAAVFAACDTACRLTFAECCRAPLAAKRPHTERAEAGAPLPHAQRL